MKITNLNELQRLRYVLENEFGWFPENLVIESKDCITEAKQYQTNIPEQISDIEIFGVKVVNGYAEIL